VSEFSARCGIRVRLVLIKNGGKMKNQKRIVPLMDDNGRVKLADYLEARKLTRGKGGLPSNVLHDDYLVRSDKWKGVQKVYPAWAREILVYPEKDGLFSGRDVVDSNKDGKGRRWILPASYIPKEAVGKEGVGLFINPQEVKEEKGRVVVYPRSVIILHPFIQQSCGGGKVDDNTRIPLKVDPELWKDVPVEERRWLLRMDGAGVRPLVRSLSMKDIETYRKPDNGLWVAHVRVGNLFQEKEPVAEGITK
jgi:hypothetical protein